MEKLDSLPDLITYNLGTGKGYSVSMCYEDSNKARVELGWTAKFDVKEICEDTWRWQSNNLNGFKVEETG